MVTLEKLKSFLNISPLFSDNTITIKYYDEKALKVLKNTFELYNINYVCINTNYKFNNESFIKLNNILKKENEFYFLLLSDNNKSNRIMHLSSYIFRAYINDTNDMKFSCLKSRYSELGISNYLPIKRLNDYEFFEITS